MNWLYVFIGGGVGSLFRYLIVRWTNSISSTLFMGTFFVNIFGSLLIGFIAHFIMTRQQTSSLHGLLISGFCGGFTTFSSFSFENFNLLRQGNYMEFMFYTFGALGLGILSVFLGMGLSKIIFIEICD